MAQVDGAEVVIIGAGVTGLASAWFLAKSGVDVIVIEKGVIGYEASSRNGGICAYHRGVEPKGLMGYEETKLWHNLEEAVKAAGGTLQDIVKTTTFVTDADHFTVIRNVRNELWNNLKMPANTMVVAKSLANPEYLVAIEAIAVVD